MKKFKEYYRYSWDWQCYLQFFSFGIKKNMPWELQNPTI
jgi:hypothetical protein